MIEMAERVIGMMLGVVIAVILLRMIGIVVSVTYPQW